MIKKTAFLAFLLINSIIQANAISLSTGSETFNGLLLEGSNSPNVGVIFFHGRGQTPNGDVVRQLRQTLNNDGYTTLSIDNPVPVGGTGFANYLANESVIESQVFSYFNSAVDSLLASNSNIDTIVIGGFSLGSRFATATAAAWEQGLLEIDSNVSLGGLIGVGMYGNIGSTPATTPNDINTYDTVNNLSLISSVPILDLYGNLDSNAANFATDRMAAFGGDNLSYTQLALACPDFANNTFYTRNQGVAVSYTENRCHQLRNGFLDANNAASNINPDVTLRGSADAPLESTTSQWMKDNIPLTPVPVPVPASLWLFFSGLIGLLGVVKKKKHFIC